jgi:hypothetical protein
VPLRSGDLQEQSPGLLSGQRTGSAYGFQGACRHVREEGFTGSLDNGQAAGTFNIIQAGCAVIEHAAQDDADHVFAVILGGGTEQRIDGRPLPVLFGAMTQSHNAVFDPHVVIGRGNVNKARVYFHCIARMLRAQAAGIAQDFRPRAVTQTRNMRHHQKGGGGFPPEWPEKRSQDADTASGGPDGDYYFRMHYFASSRKEPLNAWVGTGP